MTKETPATIPEGTLIPREPIGTEGSQATTRCTPAPAVASLSVPSTCCRLHGVEAPCSLLFPERAPRIRPRTSSRRLRHIASLIQQFAFQLHLVRAEHVAEPRSSFIREFIATRPIETRIAQSYLAPWQFQTRPELSGRCRSKREPAPQSCGCSAEHRGRACSPCNDPHSRDWNCLRVLRAGRSPELSAIQHGSRGCNRRACRDPIWRTVLHRPRLQGPRA